MALRLTKWQRDEIHYLRDHQHYSWRKIEFAMGVDHSVLLREYNRNKKRGWVYDPILAQQKTYQRNHFKKKQCKTIRMCNALEDYILEKLEWWRSPECIAGRWNAIDKDMHQTSIKLQLPTITWITIRRYIHSKYGYWIKDYMIYNKLLKHRKQKPSREKRTWGKILNRTFIDLRPLLFSQPKTIWHFECDFIVSKRWDSTVVMTLIDKFSRLKVAVKLPSRDSVVVFDALVELINKYHILSITFDNDTWFALHYLLWIPTFFCHTYSSREKWQVERGNRWYRIFFPKGTILSQVNQEDINKASKILNDTPMKCLKYKTPNEIWKQELNLRQWFLSVIIIF